MEIDSTKIVPADELNLDVELIQSRLRSIGEIVVFYNNRPQFRICSVVNTERGRTHAAAQALSDANNRKIGEYVQENMRKLFFMNAISENELRNLLSFDYSKRVFNSSKPLLKKVDPSRSIDEQRKDARGYARYYKSTIRAYGNEYLLSSQWVDRQRAGFKVWLSQFGIH